MLAQCDEVQLPQSPVFLHTSSFTPRRSHLNAICESEAAAAWRRLLQGAASVRPGCMRHPIIRFARARPHLNFASPTFWDDRYADDPDDETEWLLAYTGALENAIEQHAGEDKRWCEENG